MNILSIVLFVLVFSGVGLGVFLVADLRKHVIELLEFYESEEVVEDEVDEENEKQRAFNERINLLKYELSQSVPPRKPHTTTAEILHPAIENLPHDSIIESNPPKEEYSV